MTGYITIINIQNKTKNEDVFRDIIVDRTNLILGNPYILNDKSNQIEREKVITQFAEKLEQDIKNQGIMFNELLNIKSRLEKGENIALKCWCNPDCHAEIIADRVQKMMAENVYRKKPTMKNRF